MKSSSGHIDVHDELRVRPRERVDRVVGVQRLRALARTDLDAGRRAQLLGTEHAVEHVEHERMGRQVVERARLGEQRVDAPGPAPFEVVATVRRRLDQACELGADLRDGFGIDDVLDDAVSVEFEVRLPGVIRVTPDR